MPSKKKLPGQKKGWDLPIAIRYLEEQLRLAKEFKFPEFKRWEINWSRINAIQNTNSHWSDLKIYNLLELNKGRPAIYYFSSPQKFTADIHTTFQTLKKKQINGSAAQGTESHNICNVPKYFTETSYLYVGSVKRNLHLRFLSHLGYGHRKTGALFLKQVLSNVNNPQKIYFNYCFLEPKFTPIRTMAEYEKQYQLKPLLGSQSFIKSEGYFVASYNHEFDKKYSGN
jgi:hypothetical protein